MNAQAASAAPLQAPPADGATRTRLTALGWLVVAETAALTSTAFWQERPLGVTLAIGLAGALAIAIWWAGRSLAGIRGQWSLPPTAHAGDEVTVGATLTATHGAPPLQLQAFQPVTRRDEIMARLPGLDGLPTRPSWTTRFPKRGMTKLPPLTVRSELPFGLVRAERKLGDGAEVLVLPAIGRVRRELRTRLNQWLEAQAATNEIGDDEIARLRDYRAGDHPHRIHWKASARHRSLLVAERHAPGCRRLALVVDTATVGDGRRLERILCVTATLVDHFVALGWSLTLHGAFAPLGADGRRHQLMETLALAGTSSSPVLNYVPPHRTTVILALTPQVITDLRPQPLVLTLAECEQLVWIPRRVR